MAKKKVSTRMADQEPGSPDAGAQPQDEPDADDGHGGIQEDERQPADEFVDQQGRAVDRLDQSKSTVPCATCSRMKKAVMTMPTRIPIQAPKPLTRRSSMK